MFRKIGTMVTILTLVMIYSSCAQKEEGGGEQEFVNALINETSPYLLQHADNPVNWYPWGEEALKLAKTENKLLIVSIGYSSCHWCHVMEHESFEDSTVAKVMNDNYVAIKIDREERPDIDQIYIEAAQLMNGRAGWPLNTIALPDGTPIFTGTYFPKDQWIRILENVQDIYIKDPERVHEQSKKVMENLRQLNTITSGPNDMISFDDLLKSIDLWKERMDRKNGGMQSQNKFPLPGALQELLDFGVVQQEDEALELVELTLDRMAMGGIFDHIGGGFHRYTVEPTWKIPHFEKMLYDNAQLMSLYSAGYQVFGKPIYRAVVEKTANFILNEMTSPVGGFYSSFDADSEGVEGKFYVWSQHEIDSILGKDSKAFSQLYNISKNGNWEDGMNIIYLSGPMDNMTYENQRNLMDTLLEKLGSARKRRIAPGLDDKTLTAWNGLMTQGFIDAYRALGNPDLLEAAKRNARFVVETQMAEDGRLYRNYKDGKSVINGFLDDYAFTISAFIKLYQVTFDPVWLEHSLTLTTYVLDHFYVPEYELFRYTSDLDPPLIVDKYGTTDNVIPSGNSIMANNLFVLGNIFFDTKQRYLEIARNMASKVAGDMVRAPFYYYGWVPLAFQLTKGYYEIAIVGPDVNHLRMKMMEHYIPDAFYLGSTAESDLPLLENKFVEGKTFIYVCREKYCKLPVTETERALTLIER